MADRSVSITIDVSSSGAVEGVKDVEGATANLETQGGESVRSFGDSMKVALGNIAASAAEQLAVQLRALINRGRELVQRGAEIREIQDRFNTVFGESREVVQGFIEDQAQMMGLSEVAAQDLMASAAAQAQALGFAREESAGFSQEIATLAGDLASFHDEDPQRTFDAITSALAGEREQLKQFDIVLRQSMINQRALANTSKESSEALTQQERATASLQLMYENAGTAIGDAERTMDSAARTGARAEAAWGNVRDEMAKQLLPAAAELNKELLNLAESEEVMDTVQAAAKELSDQLVEGIRLASDFIQMFSENREEIEMGAKAVGLLATGVSSYVAATKLQVLWTRRAVIAQQAAALAQRGLNAVMRANPVGLVVSALTVVLPLIWRFRGAIMEAAASVLEFSATSMRGLQGVVDWLQELAEKIPDAVATGPLAVFKAGVQGLDEAVAGSADQFETWADSLRDAGEETEVQTVKMGENKNQMDLETDALQDNTEAQKENKDAREEMPEAPGVPEVEPDNQVIEQEAEFSGSLTLGVEGIEASLRHGLIESISEAETAIQSLQQKYDQATTQGARDEIQALIDKLKGHKDEMESVEKEFVDFGPAVEKSAEQALTKFGEGIGQMMAGVSTASDIGREVLGTLASLAERVGRIAIGAGIAVEGIRRALQSLNPVAAIAAGAALIALAATVRSRLAQAAEERGDGGGSPRRDRGPSDARVPGFQEGVTNFEGGLARVHEEELLVNMPPGTDVVPKGSQLPLSKGIKRQAGGGGQGLEQKLDEVAQRFEEKQFRLRGTDQVTQQERTQAVYDDAGIK